MAYFWVTGLPEVKMCAASFNAAAGDCFPLVMSLRALSSASQKSCIPGLLGM